jgi:putative sterol carrier protein
VIGMAEKIFSEEWCKLAMAAENEASPEIIKRFKRPTEFTHVFALEVGDRPGVQVHLKYEEGHCVALTSELFPEDEVWARFTASLETWQKAVSGGAKPSNLVMAGKMKLTKGAMKDALENAAPFDRLVQSFGEVDTDFEI